MALTFGRPTADAKCWSRSPAGLGSFVPAQLIGCSQLQFRPFLRRLSITQAPSSIIKLPGMDLGKMIRVIAPRPVEPVDILAMPPFSFVLLCSCSSVPLLDFGPSPFFPFFSRSSNQGNVFSFFPDAGPRRTTTTRTSDCTCRSWTSR